MQPTTTTHPITNEPPKMPHQHPYPDFTGQQAQHEVPPPPYTDIDTDSSSNEDSDSDDDNEDEITLTINAETRITGTHNLTANRGPSASPLNSNTTHAMQAAVHIVNALQQIKRIHATTTRPRKLKLDLTVNCGVSVVGDRNVVGNVGTLTNKAGAIAVTPAPAARTSGGDVPQAAAGATAGTRTKAQAAAFAEHLRRAAAIRREGGVFYGVKRGLGEDGDEEHVPAKRVAREEMGA